MKTLTRRQSLQQLSSALLATTLFLALPVQAQNIATVNGKPVPKARVAKRKKP